MFILVFKQIHLDILCEKCLDILFILNSFESTSKGLPLNLLDIIYLGF